MSAVAASILACVAAASSISRCFSAMASSNLACMASRPAWTSASSPSAIAFSLFASSSVAWASLSARIFGSTTAATQWYLTMDRHQLHRPATAPADFLASSKLKSGASK